MPPIQENVLQGNVLLHFGRGATRLFRINAGMGWVGRILSKTKDLIVLENPRPFHGAPTGSSDLLGWHSITVTPEMVGRRLAVFVAVEVKRPKAGKAEAGSASPEQRSFIAAVQAAGGVGVIARSEADVEAALAGAGRGAGAADPRPALERSKAV